MTDTERPTPWLEFKLCLGLLTRVPVTLKGRIPAHAMAWASRWFPVVGALVGGVSAIVLCVCVWLGIPNTAAALLAIGAGILFTGALHEDGLADTADGFGGGFDAPARLEIMRDSRIGTYGVLALIFSIGLHWWALIALLSMSLQAAVVSLIVAGAVSRVTPVWLMYALTPARPDGMAVDAGKPELRTIYVASALALTSLLLLSTWLPMVLVILVTLAVFAGIGALSVRRIGGQTGDVLGAGQQLTEILVLVALATVGS